MVGYSKESEAYRWFGPIKKEVINQKDIIFDE